MEDRARKWMPYPMKINAIYWHSFSFFLNHNVLIWYFPKAIGQLRWEKWKKNSQK